MCKWQPWSSSAGTPGRVNHTLPQPRIFRGTGGRYSNPHRLISREGGENNQEAGRNRGKTREYQRRNQPSQRFQGRDRGAGRRYDDRSDGVHPEICWEVRVSRFKAAEEQARLKRAALYMRVSTVDQHPETQLLDLRQMASQRGYEIIHEYTDRISGVKAKRPGLDAMMAEARHGRFDVVLVWASDRIARSVKHFLDVLDELNRLNIEYVSFRENIDTGGPLGRAIVVIIGAVAELERNLIIERVRAGMRRARLEGQHIGRNPLVLDNAAIQQDRSQGQSLRQIAKGHRISTATVQRVLRQYPIQILDKIA